MVMFGNSTRNANVNQMLTAVQVIFGLLTRIAIANQNTHAVQDKLGEKTPSNALASTPKIAVKGTTGEPIQTTALANLILTAAQMTTGKPTIIASVTPLKIKTVAAVISIDPAKTILAVQLATKLVAFQVMMSFA
jgi:hypothetical protein